MRPRSTSATHFRADGRWRLYAFADADGSAVADRASWLEDSEDSPVNLFSPENTDIVSVFDAKVIYQQSYHDIDLAKVPRLFLPKVGHLQIIDWEKVYSTIEDDDIFDNRSVDRSGALVIVRPDMYVAHILPLSARAELTECFAQSMVREKVLTMA
nr:hypothetical protein [Brevibacterium sandarakinum]